MRLRVYSLRVGPVVPKAAAWCIIGLCVVGALLGLAAYVERSGPREPAPPDLTGCTRIEFRFLPSALTYCFPTGGSETILNPDELQYLTSLETLVMEDQEVIKALARHFSRGRYRRGSYGQYFGVADAICMTCYRGGKPAVSFEDRGRLLGTEGGRWFEYDQPHGLLGQLAPQVEALRLRSSCAYTLRGLDVNLKSLARGNPAYPPPAQWCDVVAARHRPRSHGPYEDVMGGFRCPLAIGERCPYAMNPDCRPDSPADTVLLFDTKPDWNQQGGAELFSFDNHSPRGGLVLLNDGTVRFIRTEEQLKQLRWK